MFLTRENIASVPHNPIHAYLVTAINNVAALIDVRVDRLCYLYPICPIALRLIFPVGHLSPTTRFELLNSIFSSSLRCFYPKR